MSTTSPSVQGAFSARGVEAPTFVFESNADAGKYVARQIANLVRNRNAQGKTAVLGLVSGSSPIGVYQELVRLYKEDGLDLSRTSIFMVNEYYGVDSDRLQSLRRWLLENFVNKTNVPLENVHCFDASVKSEDLEQYCLQYEREIADAGGIDFLLLGVAVNGAVGFNEPYTSKKSRARLATLDHQTRLDAASLFFSESNVPTHGLTIGFGTMLEAKKIVVLAFGDRKAAVIQRALEDPVTDETPAGWLRVHDDVSFVVDKNAASALKDVATPWRVRRVEWDDSLIKRAALWLCGQSGKSLLKLTDSDFRASGLHSLLRDVGSAPVVSDRVFTQMMNTIALHPCGLNKKRVLIFSPHPDDDVISMGGTMIRLVDDGHELHVAYMTSGNIAVNDYDARRIGDLLAEIDREYGKHEGKDAEGTWTIADFVESKILDPLLRKKPGDIDSREALDLKRLIRWSEARAADRVCGIPEERVHFLNLPFYDTGAVEKKPASDLDRKIARDLIESIDPEAIFVAGDLSDPHGTHRVCALVVFSVLEQMKKEGKNVPEILLYRGAWQEWPLDQIEIAVPLSPKDSEKKREAIFRHASQKDGALFLGDDAREFWQRAEDRNLATAAAYNKIGLPEYYAVEAFVHWDGSFDY